VVVTVFHLPLEGQRKDIAVDWALRHADGSMTFEEIAAFAAWIGEAAANGKAFDEAMAAWDMMEDSRLDPDCVALRCEALNALQETRDQPPRWAALRLISLAASVAAVFSLSLGLYLWNRPDHYTTGPAERRVVALADGSRITMDASTSVLVSLASQSRNLVLERGRATFAVAKDPLRPFSVTSHDSVVVATGTQFSVEQVNAQTRVVLYQGHVAILRKSGNRLVPSIVTQGGNQVTADSVLVPGRELIVPDAAGTLHLRSVTDPGAERAWERGQMDVADEPLGIAAARMNRYLATPRLHVSGDAAQIRISGLFDAGDVDAFVNGVATIAPVAVDRKPDGSFDLRQQSTSTLPPR
jgi:transmembrane sensor